MGRVADDSPLHDARVLVRRSRALLRTAQGRAAAPELSRETLGALLRLSGPARDAQVLRAFWSRFRAVEGRLRRVRRVRTDDARALRRALARLRRRVRRLRARETGRRMHRVRVAAKELRYLLESAGDRPGFPKARALKAAQTALGTVRDLDLVLETARRERRKALAAARHIWKSLPR